MNSLTDKLWRTGSNWIGSLPNPFRPEKIHIITDGHDWVITQVAKSLAQSLTNKNVAQVHVSPFFHFFSGKVIHFNSVPVPKKFPRNKVIHTWYHVNQDDPRLKELGRVASRIDLLHTTAQTTKAILMQQGFPEEKIRVIPMGINLGMFTSSPASERKHIRTELRIPEKAFVIGSFQKDGDGWGAGMNPKWIKGPDVFCDVVERVAKELPVHVLLSGPSRGYVKDRLTRANIPFTHQFVSAYADVNTLYQALDVYLISSRTEGVPMALLEAWATGTPLVSTRVGMVMDVAVDGQNALLADIEDRDKLTTHLLRLQSDSALRTRLTSEGIQQAQCHRWEILSNRYWEELYKPLLRNSEFVKL
ncbi:glycosyltransferase family 4 protein [Candidatus Uhrbacteria bacterium]|nr:glycosyltransferase family 4 protein [Candidatus Uhrbacteria bacterium]